VIPVEPREEVESPAEVAQRLRGNQAVTFAPGDGYLYGVALVQWENPVFVKESLIVQGGPLNPMFVLRFDPPENEWEKWDHRRWERYGFPETVYAGLIPLLAALGWAGDRPPFFDRDAVREFE
jgi:hypothetical protein